MNIYIILGLFVFIIISVTGMLMIEKIKNSKITNLKNELNDIMNKIKSKEDLLNLFDFIQKNNLNNNVLKDVISLYKIGNSLKIEIQLGYEDFVFHTIEYKDKYKNDIIYVYDLDKLFLTENIDLETKSINAIKLILIDYLSIQSSNLDNIRKDSKINDILSLNPFVDLDWDIQEVFLEIEDMLLSNNIPTNELDKLYKNDGISCETDIIINDLIALIKKYDSEDKINLYLENQKIKFHNKLKI